ncbi:MAG: hypothetical protein IJ062_01715 [Firmicutes bacterium]|nr:hypothetical protein [Bacillota bacterium]
MKKIIFIIMMLIMSVPVYADGEQTEIDDGSPRLRVGNADSWAPSHLAAETFPRVPVGNKGHYLVGSYAKDKIKRGFLIEDEAGNDLFGFLDDTQQISITLFDPENEIYGVNISFLHPMETYGYLMNGDFKVFGDGTYDYPCWKPNRLKYKDFYVFFMSYSVTGPINKENAFYYDKDGNIIEDVEEYVKQRGAKFSEGTYLTQNGEMSVKAAREEWDEKVELNRIMERNKKIVAQVKASKQILAEPPVRSIIGIGVCLLILSFIAVKNIVSSIFRVRKVRCKYGK